LNRNGYATTGVSLVKCPFGQRFVLAEDQCHAAIADATLGDNTIGKVLHVSA
jgi:hypothetical protein